MLRREQKTQRRRNSKETRIVRVRKKAADVVVGAVQ